VSAEELLLAACAEQDLFHRVRVGRYESGVDLRGGVLPPSENQWSGGGFAVHAAVPFLGTD
jgi:hypothetical protein